MALLTKNLMRSLRRSEMLSFGASLLFDSEIEHMEAKYEFEAGNLDKAFEIWQNLVKQKGVGYRYFEYDDPKYIKFYKSRK